MFKKQLDRYKNYLINFQQKRGTLPNCKQRKNIKIFYKKMTISTFYLKRQVINLYKPIKSFKYNHTFLFNINVVSLHFEKDQKRRFFA